MNSPSGAESELDHFLSALQAETELRLQAEERLNRLQTEFEEFILVATHDFKEPLRTIAAYSELLTRKSSSQDKDSEQFRRHIADGAERIQALLAGMVDYATASSPAAYPMLVEMDQVFREAAAAPGIQSGERNVNIMFEPLPAVMGDAERLVRIARHLLENAVRYCENGDCRIHVAAHRHGGDWLFKVADNGPGIEKNYQQKIFEPFKRLHSRQKAGCGLGLAYCRRVIEAHGGRIWVESIPKQGATFCFSLPCPD